MEENNRNINVGGAPGQAGNPYIGGAPGQAGNPYMGGMPGQAGNPYMGGMPGQAGNPYMGGIQGQAGNPYMGGAPGQAGSPYMGGMAPQPGMASQPGMTPQPGMAPQPDMAARISQAKKTFSRIGWCYIAGMVIMNVLEIVAMLGVSLFRPGLMRSMNTSLIISLVCIDGTTLPLIWLLAGNMPKTAPERHRIKWWEFLAVFAMCYAATYVCNLVGQILTLVIGAMKGSAVENMLGSSPVLLFVNAVLVGPVMEELLFRKVLVDRTLQYGQGMAIGLSGLMFGLFHGNLNQFAYTVVLGTFFAFVYVKTGDIRITIGLHMMINFMGSVIAVWMTDLLRIDDLADVDTADVGAVMNIIAENPTGWLIAGMYALFISCLVLTGIILLIVFGVKGKFRLQPVGGQIPKGQRFSTMFFNPGMIVYIILWSILIVTRLFR